MNRIIFYALIAAIIVLVIFSLWNAQYAYRLLPVNANQKMDIDETDTWQPFTSPLGNFSAKLPVRPQQASERTLDPRTKQPLYYDMYVSEALNGNTYMISTITYPQGGIEDDYKDTLMTRVMHDMVSQNKDNELVDISKGYYEGLDMMNFEVKTSKKYIRTRTFIDNDVVYILSGIADHNRDKTEEYQFFINSFSLIPNKEQK